MGFSLHVLHYPQIQGWKAAIGPTNRKESGAESGRKEVVYGQGGLDSLAGYGRGESSQEWTCLATLDYTLIGFISRSREEGVRGAMTSVKVFCLIQCCRTCLFRGTKRAGRGIGGSQ
jgi:hypothetical protein